LPTLLATTGNHRSTISDMAGVSATDWSRGGPHPYEYTPKDVKPELFTEKLRLNSHCGDFNHSRVQQYAQTTFVPISDIAAASGQECRALQQARGADKEAQRVQLDGRCSLTARKFKSDTADAVLDVVVNDCGRGAMRLLSKEVCAVAMQQRKRAWRSSFLDAFW
jgi:hypothetical protein